MKGTPLLIIPMILSFPLPPSSRTLPDFFSIFFLQSFTSNISKTFEKVIKEHPPFHDALPFFCYHLQKQSGLIEYFIASFYDRSYPNDERTK